MKNKIDYIYAYSDLNLFQTRVKILTGNYAGIVLEFGASALEQYGNQNNFHFDYTLYEVSDNYHTPTLRADQNFINYLAYLLVKIIDDKNHDPEEKSKLEATAGGDGMSKCPIEIDSIFYPKWIQTAKKKVISRGLQGF